MEKLKLDSNSWSNLMVGLQDIEDAIQERNIHMALNLIEILSEEVRNANLID